VDDEVAEQGKATVDSAKSQLKRRNQGRSIAATLAPQRDQAWAE